MTPDTHIKQKELARKNLTGTIVILIVCMFFAYSLKLESDSIKEQLTNDSKFIYNPIADNALSNHEHMQSYAIYLRTIIKNIDLNTTSSWEGELKAFAHDVMASDSRLIGINVKKVNGDTLFISQGVENDVSAKDFLSNDILPVNKDTGLSKYLLVDDRTVIQTIVVESTHIDSLQVHYLLTPIKFNNDLITSEYQIHNVVLKNGCPMGEKCSLPEGFFDTSKDMYDKSVVQSQNDGKQYIIDYYVNWRFENKVVHYWFINANTLERQYYSSLFWRILFVLLTGLALYVSLRSFIVQIAINEQKDIDNQRERTEVEERFQTVQNLLRLFDGLPVSTLIIKGNGEVLYASSGLQSLFYENNVDVEEDVVLGMCFLHDKMGELKIGNFDQTLFVDGEARTFNFYARHIPQTQQFESNNSENASHIFTCFDVTEERALKINLQSQVNKKTEEIQKLLKNEKENNAAKSVFLSTVSHEMRTPLNGIKGALSLLSGTTFDQTDKKYFDIIRQSSNNLLRLVNDVLDLTKIQSNKLEILKKPFDILETLDRVVQSVSINKKQNVRVLIDNLSVFESTVIGDPLRFEQVITNLLSNAFKFTDSGYVYINIYVKKFAEKSVTFNIDVKDSGIGIPLDKQKVIFDRFSQASSDVQLIYGGTGLGLAISKRLTELMGGDLTCISEPRLGSTFSASFCFDLPQFSTVHYFEHKRLFFPYFKGCEFQDLFYRKILSYGFFVDFENRDQDATIIINNVVNKVYDVSGLKNPIIVSEVPVHVKNGTAQIISYPALSMKYLYEVLSGIDYKAEDDNEDIDKLFSHDYNRARVLVVDDNETNRVVIKGFLNSLNCEVFEAIDGEDGIEKNQHIIPDIILMDLQMPKRNGLEATKYIRANAGNKNVPIVALTAATMAGDRERCLDAGMNEFLSKPIELDELIAVLDKLLLPFTLESSPSPAEDFQDKKEVALIESNTKDDFPVWDEKQFKSRLLNNAELIDAVKSSFLDRWTEKLTTLEISYSEDIDSTRKAAHALKGMFKEVSALKLADMLYKVEIDAIDGKRDKTVLHDINDEIDILVRMLSTL